MNRFCSFLLVSLLCTGEALHGQAVSAQSGEWNNPLTWQGAAIPTSSDNVTISDTHTISIDSAVSCKSLGFSGNDAHIAFTASAGCLNIYGNMTFYSGSHQPFSYWADGARVRFTGSEQNQLLSNWNTAGTNALRLIEVDKNSGTVITSGQNLRFCFSDTLHIINGTFDLANSDDIETRSVSGAASRGYVIVESGGKFIIRGGTTYFRRGAFTIPDSARSGMWLIRGAVEMATKSSSRLNMDSIVVDSGGMVTIMNGWNTGLLNSRFFHVKAGGKLQTYPAGNVWYAGSRVQADSGSSTVVYGSPVDFPSGSIFNGIFEYGAEGFQQLAQSVTSYGLLRFTGSGTRQLSAGIYINQGCQIGGSAQVDANIYQMNYSPNASLEYNSATTAQNISFNELPATGSPGILIINNTVGVQCTVPVRVSKKLDLRNGLFQNSANTLIMSQGAILNRTRSGSISMPPAWAGGVNIIYDCADSATIETGNEIPANGSVDTFRMAGTGSVKLNKNISVQAACSMSGKGIVTGDYMLSLNGTSGIEVESESTRIRGRAEYSLSVNNTPAINALGAIITGEQLPYQLHVLRTDTMCAGITAISEIWSIDYSSTKADEPNTLYIGWYKDVDNGLQWSPGNRAVCLYSSDNGVTWQRTGEATEITGSGIRKVKAGVPRSGLYTVTDENHLERKYTLLVHAMIEGFCESGKCIPDTLQIELHDCQSNEIAAISRSLADSAGQVVCTFTNLIQSRGYYVVVRHRNALETWSAQPIQFTGYSAEYNFTTGRGKAFADNMKEVDGISYIYAGDVNQDGAVDFNDMVAIDNDSYNYVTGYVASDINGDGSVDFLDMIICDNNSFNYRQIQRPFK